MLVHHTGTTENCHEKRDHTIFFTLTAAGSSRIWCLYDCLFVIFWLSPWSFVFVAVVLLFVSCEGYSPCRYKWTHDNFISNAEWNFNTERWDVRDLSTMRTLRCLQGQHFQQRCLQTKHSFENSLMFLLFPSINKLQKRSCRKLCHFLLHMV